MSDPERERFVRTAHFESGLDLFYWSGCPARESAVPLLAAPTWVGFDRFPVVTAQIPRRVIGHCPRPAMVTKTLAGHSAGGRPDPPLLPHGRPPRHPRRRPTSVSTNWASPGDAPQSAAREAFARVPDLLPPLLAPLDRRQPRRRGRPCPRPRLARLALVRRPRAPPHGPLGARPGRRRHHARQTLKLHLYAGKDDPHIVLNARGKPLLRAGALSSPTGP